MVRTIIQLTRLARLKHWLKNGVIFLPAFFAGKIQLVLTENILYVFSSFCVASSAIYILNDMLDVKTDRTHPIKSKRPLASGHISMKVAGILLLLFTGLFIASLFIVQHSYFYVLGYFILNILYSLYLKHISIVDVSSIGIGFVLRVMAGGAALDVYVSHWMIIITFLLAISIGFAKRRDDLMLTENRASINILLSGYSIPFLDMAKGISFSMTLISYILYSISSEVITRVGSDKLYLTSLFVFLGIMRYIQITLVNKNSGSPIDVLLKDRFLQITLVLWAFTFWIILYGNVL